MKFLEKIQQLPPYKKKIILWTVIIVLGILLTVFWVLNLKRSVARFQTEDLREDMEKGGDTIREGVGEFPKIEIPEEDEEKFQEFLKDVEKETNGEQEKQQ